LFLPHSVKNRLILWAVLALAVTSAASAVVCLTYSSRVAKAAANAGTIATNQGLNFEILLPLIIPYILLLVAIIVLFSWRVNRCINPLIDLTRRCREITINNLSLRFSSTESCKEANALVTEYNTMLDRLESGVKRIRQFSGDASHELRTPLTILRGETEVGLRWAKTADEMRNILQSNMEEIERMGRIIEDLLTLAKSESGELPLSIREISLSDLLQELYLQGRTLAESKNIEVTLSHKVNEEILIRGDDLRLRQLFLNLISNAIRYTNVSGTVTIDVDRQDSEVIVEIGDNGIGIPHQHLPHIFERFYRTDEARNRTTGGTGLGLAIVKGITDAHNGTIQVTSTPNVGSTFSISLPVDGPEPKPSQK
jgi:heavy metal sensor kinase